MTEDKRERDWRERQEIATDRAAQRRKVRDAYKKGTDAVEEQKSEEKGEASR